MRHDDIPGALIPSVYFNYLEDRDASGIKKVIEHNKLDILSMVSLLYRLSAMLQDPLYESDGGLELLGLGRIFEVSGKTEDMVECLEACADSGRFDIKLQAVKRLTGIYKREAVMTVPLNTGRISNRLAQASTCSTSSRWRNT